MRAKFRSHTTYLPRLIWSIYPQEVSVVCVVTFHHIDACAAAKLSAASAVK